MGHRIEYFSKGKIIGARVCDAPLEETKKVVADEMGRLGADLVRLIDIDRIPVEVWAKRLDAP